MFIDVSPYLSHVLQYWTTTRDRNGSTLLSTVTTLSGFAFQGERIKVVGSERETLDLGWQIILGTDARTLVQTGDIIVGVKDEDDYTLISSGTVMKIAPYRHWSSGLQFYVLDIE